MNNRGFTLIEVLVSIFLIGIVAVAIFPLFSHTFSVIFSSDSKTQSINEARNELIDDLSNTSGSSVTVTFEDKDNDTTSITVKKYKINKTYQGSNKTNKNLSIKYYKYPD